MKIKLIIFDLDGVLVDAKKIHFDALNESLDDEYKISLSEHLSKYDGLKTSEKLKMLNQEKGLPTNLFSEIWDKKQNLTLLKFERFKEKKIPIIPPNGST